ncbi:MAG TPA: hypothetical protein VGA75_07210, partial [Paracoccaceae bacterium]
MPAHHYPFIDLAVLAPVRDHFARGDAVAVLSSDLSEVLWANGAAAQLFGFSNIYDALDEGLSGQQSTRRQIESAVSGLGRTGKPQNFMMRAVSGFSRLMAPAVLEDITLPDGAQALLLTSSQTGQHLAPGARARQIIAGFEGTGTHVAVLDKDGRVLAASSTFSEIGLAQADIDRMVADVSGAADRLVKRMTEARNGAMPTAIGRLADEPALHLLFAVEPPAGDETPAAIDDADAAQTEKPASEVQPETADETATAPSGEPETTTVDGTVDEATPAAESDTSADGTPRQMVFDTRRIRDELNARLAKAERENEIPAPFAEARGLEVPAVTDDGVVEDEEAEGDRTEASLAGDDATTDRPADEADLAADMDHGADEQGPVAAEETADQAPAEETVAAAPEFRFDPDGKPARFVWKINMDGEFSEVSPEFAAAVGPHAADIIGRKFPDLARVFNLDPDHVISDLLNRRDTWSGKTVFWPIQGTNLVTPVDLAALPTYTRDRRFDGFRGFGIVRIGEARPDPEALGLALLP